MNRSLTGRLMRSPRKLDKAGKRSVGEEKSFIHEKKIIPYTLKRSSRRTLSVKIDSSGSIIAQAPLLLPLFSIESFLNEKAELILGHQRQVLDSLAEEANSRPSYIKGDIFRFKGEEFILRFAKGNRIRPVISLEDKYIVVEGKETLSKDEIRSSLEKWYKKEAADFFLQRLNHCMIKAAVLGIKKVPSLSIRNMKSRWGSCRMDQNKITLNLKLIQLDVRYIDSVIYHELCHFKIGPHNRQFYQLLEQLNPFWKKDRAYLKKHYYSISGFLI